MLGTHITDSMLHTLESILETAEITDNVWQLVADGKMTASEAGEVLDAILKGEEE